MGSPRFITPSLMQVWVSKISRAWTRCFQEPRRSMSPTKTRRDADPKMPRLLLEPPGPGPWPAEATPPAPPPQVAPSAPPLRQELSPPRRRAATGTGSHVPTARPLAVPAVYEIRVTTGDRRDAGTSAQVVMELHGVEASSGEHTLVPAPGTVPFQRGTQSTMKIRCPCLGRLRAVRRPTGYSVGPYWGLEDAAGEALPMLEPKLAR